LTVKVRPAIVIVPLRAAPVFAATLNDTLPLPLPLAPLVIVIHVTLATAVHAQVLLDAVTVTVLAPPAAATVWLERSSVYVHGGGGGAAAWDTVNVLPAAVIVPLRAAPVFAATENDTEPLPVPLLLPFDSVIHAALDAAVQTHVPTDAVTANNPDPPASLTV
jgi:hypothetical protein